MTFTPATLTDEQITEACQRVIEALRPSPKSDYWVIFFETQDANGAPSYTYRYSAHGDTAEDALREAVTYLRFLDDSTRIRMATAVRADDVTDIDGYRIRLTPQFELR